MQRTELYDFIKSEACKPNGGLSDEKNNTGLTISSLKGEGRFQTDFAVPNPD